MGFRILQSRWRGLVRYNENVELLTSRYLFPDVKYDKRPRVHRDPAAGLTRVVASLTKRAEVCSSPGPGFLQKSQRQVTNDSHLHAQESMITGWRK